MTKKIKKATRKVLIVEDDMIITMVLERMIKKLNHEVVDKVSSGKNAITSALQLNPDVILMDIDLEDDIDGISAMEKIRAESDVPVIYITGNSDKYHVDRAKKTKFVDYLVKPIQMHDLEQSLAKAFSGQN